VEGKKLEKRLKEKRGGGGERPCPIRIQLGGYTFAALHELFAVPALFERVNGKKRQFGNTMRRVNCGRGETFCVLRMRTSAFTRPASIRRKKRISGHSKPKKRLKTHQTRDYRESQSLAIRQEYVTCTDKKVGLLAVINAEIGGESVSRLR